MNNSSSARFERLVEAATAPFLFYGAVTTAWMVMAAFLMAAGEAARVPPVVVQILFLAILGAGIWFLVRHVRKISSREGSRDWLVVFTAIGVLILIPAGVIHVANDAMSRFTSKARQSEAKIALAAIYGSEMSYFSEYRSYVPSFDRIGYVSEGQRRFYVLGFPYACAPEQKLWNGTETAITLAEKEKIEAFFRELGPCRDMKSGFDAYAVGVIRNTGKLDVWKIDEGKVLSNVAEGL